MNYVQCAAVVIAAAGLAARSHADSVPPGWEANNLEAVGYSALDNRKGAFKMAIKKVNGHWYLYMGHLWHYGWSIVDVTDPKDPKFVKTIPGPGNTWTIQMTLHDNIMVTALEKSSLAWGADPNKDGFHAQADVDKWLAARLDRFSRARLQHPFGHDRGPHAAPREHDDHEHSATVFPFLAAPEAKPVSAASGYKE